MPAINVASSAVNRQIIKLEEEIGAPLFDRLSSGPNAGVDRGGPSDRPRVASDAIQSVGGVPAKTVK